MTSNKYLNSLKVFDHQFMKYWGEGYYVVGFDAPTFPLSGMLDFLSLGDQKDYPINKWSDGLLHMLDVIEDEVLILLFEDYWLIEPVKTDIVYRMYDYMLMHPDVLKVDLASDRQFANPVREFGKWGEIELLLSHPKSPYHMSLYVGLWRKSLLQRVIIPDEDPWMVEMDGTSRLAEFGDEMLVVGTKSCPVKITLGHRGGDPTKTLTSELPYQDIEHMKELGYL